MGGSVGMGGEEDFHSHGAAETSRQVQPDQGSDERHRGPRVRHHFVLTQKPRLGSVESLLATCSAANSALHLVLVLTGGVLRVSMLCRLSSRSSPLTWPCGSWSEPHHPHVLCIISYAHGCYLAHPHPAGSSQSSPPELALWFLSWTAPDQGAKLAVTMPLASLLGGLTYNAPTLRARVVLPAQVCLVCECCVYVCFVGPPRPRPHCCAGSCTRHLPQGLV